METNGQIESGTHLEAALSGPDPLPIRQKPVRSGDRLNKKTVGVLIGSLSLVLFFVVLSAFAPKNNDGVKPPEIRKAQPGELVKNLPSDYSKLPKPPKLGPPRPTEIARTEVLHEKEVRELTAEEKYLLEEQMRRLKRQTQAKESDLSFSGVKLDGDNSALTQSSRGMFGDGTAVAEPGTPPNPRDDDNRQDDKLNFLTGTKGEETRLSERLSSPRSPYTVFAGTVIPGVLITGINSDLPGQILGQVSQNIFDTVSGNYLLIPQGTRVVGAYDSRVAYGQERVLIVWTRLIFPNGDSISLEGMPGVDLTGYAGLTDKVNNHYLKLLSGVVLTSMLGAGAEVARGSNNTFDPSYSELAVEGMATNLNQVGQQLTRKNLNIQPTLEITPGFRFNVFVTKDITLKPYN